MAECSKKDWIKSIVTDITGTEKESATFTIHKEEDNGDFTGKFKVDGGQPEDISGNCSNDHIGFERQSGNFKYRYEGKLTKKPHQPDELEVKNGTRTQINVSLTNEGGSQSQSRGSETTAPAPPPPPDDWIAEQGGTLFNSPAQKP